jgi:hypothetical protein
MIAERMSYSDPLGIILPGRQGSPEFPQRAMKTTRLVAESPQGTFSNAIDDEYEDFHDD